jgi:hypothetical protein
VSADPNGSSPTIVLVPAGVTRRPLGNVASNEDGESGPTTPLAAGAR